MKSIVHITTVPESLGFLRGQATFMRAHGIAFSVISSPGPKLADFSCSEAPDATAIVMQRTISPIADIRALAAIIARLRHVEPVIVHAHTPKGGLLGMISAWLVRTPLRVYHMRGLPYMTASGRQRILLRSTEWLSCKLAHRVFCVSHSLRDVAIADGVVSSEKITVFLGGSGNGVDARTRFNPATLPVGTRNQMRSSLDIPPDSLVVGFVGRIVRDKGVSELASAWHALRDDFPSAHLVLIGPEEARDPVSPETLAGLREDSRVHLIGSVADPAPWYSAFDLVVLPTFREGFPNVPLEAAAMEVPVIASRIPGCVDAVKDGATGTLVPPGNSETLAKAIRMYIADPDLRLKHGSAGRKRVLEEFQQEAIWEAMYQEYRRLLTARGIHMPEFSAQATT